MGQNIQKNNLKDEEIDEYFKIVIAQKEVSRNDFKIIELLSKKEYTKVYLVEQVETKQLFVMKLMDKYFLYDRDRIDCAMKELKIFKTFQHQFIVKLAYAFQDYTSLYQIYEYCSGADLGYQMKFKDNFSEEQTRAIISCLILAIEKCHKQNLIILGLTPQHVLLDSMGYPRIIGFMDSYTIGDSVSNIIRNDLFTEYLAPEVLLRQAPGIEADFYSLGMIMYEMMVGKKQLQQDLLFDVDSGEQENIIKVIMEKKTKVKESDLPQDWSLDSADFINKLIMKSNLNRLGYYGAKEIKSHSWLKGVNWKKLEQKVVELPFIPKSKFQESSSFFKRIPIMNNKINESAQNFTQQQIYQIQTLDYQEKFDQFYYSNKNISQNDQEIKITEEANNKIEIIMDEY